MIDFVWEPNRGTDFKLILGLANYPQTILPQERPPPSLR